ncbi:MAG: hypothetical protein GY708_25075 [Actinomycetia bacterium]|nr:hypothetical protein [Actinomycetes bacterium]
MIKQISVFELTSGGVAEWPGSLLDRFRGNSRHDVFSFDAGSDLEEDFEARLRPYGLGFSKNQLLKVTGNDLYIFPFHYLSPREDRYYDKGAFRDLSSGCPGNEGFKCGVGQVQVEKVTVDGKKSKNLDIMMDAGWPRPFVYLVSRRLRGLLVQESFSGYCLVPCLRSGAQYSEDERSVGFLSDRLEEEATHFQLVVTGRAPGLPSVGRVLRAFSECPRCNTVHGGFFESFARFKPEDLAEEDFQVVWGYNSTNRDRFGIRGELFIVSRDVLRFFRQNKVSGLGPYLTAPRIPHGIVDVRD